jgi:transposase-like protein
VEESEGKQLNATLEVIEEVEPKCRTCSSMKVSKAGRRLSPRGDAIRQVYVCKSCGTRFTAGVPTSRAFGRFDTPVVGFVVKRVEQGYRVVDIIPMVETAFGKRVSDASIYRIAHALAPGRISKRNKRRILPAALMVAVRKLVPLEALAKEMGCSPVLVDRLMKEVAFIGQYPKFLTLGWEIRDLAGVQKKLREADSMVEMVQANLKKKQEGKGRFD